MNKISFAFLLVVSVCFAGNVFCMKPDYVDVPISEEWIDLSEVEKGMFLQLIDQEGIEPVSGWLAQRKEPILVCRGTVRKYTCFNVARDFTVYDKMGGEPLASLVFDTLQKNSGLPSNDSCLGYYTKWWNTLPNGQITVKCIFNDKRVLQKVIDEYKAKNNYCIQFNGY